MRQKFLNWLLKKQKVRDWLLKYYTYQVKSEFLRGRYYLSIPEWQQYKKTGFLVEAVNRYRKFIKKWRIECLV